MLRHIDQAQEFVSSHTLKPKPFGSMVQCIENHIQQNPLPGMFFAFISGIFGYIQAVPVNPSTLEYVCKVVGQISIIIGFLIAILTLVIKSKEFYITFIKKEKTVRKRKKGVSSE